MLEGIELYFGKYGGCDYKIYDNAIQFGIEPSYIYEHRHIICIHENIKLSYISRGIAWGFYGSNVAQTTKYYGQYKSDCKFTRFIDKWHFKLFKVK